MHRRKFIKALSLSAAGLPLSNHAQPVVTNNDDGTEFLSPLELPSKNQTWLGKEFWSNRLQDWRINSGRIECLEGSASFEVRTVSLLTRSLSSKSEPGRLRCTLGLQNPGKKGFAGFLIGVGGGELDYRAAALAQRAPGENGGLIAAVDDAGELHLIDYSQEANPLDFTKLSVTSKSSGSNGPKAANWMLECGFRPSLDGRFTVTLSLYDSYSKQRLNSAVYNDIPSHFLRGGISLVSSPELGHDGAKWWFSNILTSSGKVSNSPDRALGPVLGCLHSLNSASSKKSVLKLTAQLFPLAVSAADTLLLEVFDPTSKRWVERASSQVEDGYVGLFRVGDWDARQEWRYRIRFRGEDVVLYDGNIARGISDSKPLSIALFSCILPTAKGLDLIDYKKLIPQERVLGRYTPDNILFPHKNLVANCEKSDPDIYLFCGDQYYETFPTRVARYTAEVKLDTLYRWYLWLWTFREVLRNKPCIVLADDHDVLQGNLWGNAGLEPISDTQKDLNNRKEEAGGYTLNKDLVRMVYRIQHSHNPDSYADTKIKYDIPVSYGSFIYRGTDFAFVEDRKYKSPPDYEADPLTVSGELLGTQQEAFLAEWALENKDMPKVCLTASMWGSPQTAADGSPLLDYDANGYPPDARTRAVELVAQANALVLAGDQHLGMVAHQGVESFKDGATFFAGPAAAAFWQRWFEADGKLKNQRNEDPNTGDFVDTFGNKMRVLAVANPKISHAEFDQSSDGWGKFLADHKLKSEGYGIIRVDLENDNFILECWSSSATNGQTKQFDGWPVVHPIFRTSQLADQNEDA